MSELRTSLLREKFVIEEIEDSEDGRRTLPITAMSNRIALSLISEDGTDNETFIVRTHNMHSCARLSAAITREFYERGSIVNRANPISWKTIWGNVIKGYEKNWNPEIWGAIYHKGRIIFDSGEHHPFLDIIEQCDAHNDQAYSQSVEFAEEAFEKAGKKVHINYDSNVALVVSCKEDEAKCGIIIRTPDGATTFNYTARPNDNSDAQIHAHTTLTVAAAFLEATQLAFKVGMLNRKQQYRLIEKYSDEDKQHGKAKNRLGNLNRAINNYENQFHVNYRPDRPTFQQMVNKAEDFATQALKPLIKQMIDEGALDDTDWIV